MSLQANITLNTLSVSAGQPAQATLTVYNPNASAVVVTGVNVYFKALGDALPGHTSALPVVIPATIGQTTSVPALSSITFPFSVVVPSAASSNVFQQMYTTGTSTPINSQGSQPLSLSVIVAADVYGSDLSINAAGTATLIVSPSVSSPLGMQGGFLNASTPSNSMTAVIF